MEILTIHVSPIISRCFENQFTVRNTHSFEQALQCIEAEDFHCVVLDLRHSSSGDQHLLNLLAHTTIGTRIIALAHPGSILDLEYWNNQGVSLLADKDDTTLGVRIQQIINN